VELETSFLRTHLQTMNRILFFVIIFVFQCSFTVATTCDADGLSGTCIDTNSQKCGGILLPGFCSGPSNIVCCVTSLPSCHPPNCGVGICTLTSDCPSNKVHVPGYCPGPDTVECCTDGDTSWNRTDALDVAAAWVNARVKYSWTAAVSQWVTHGQGPYRSDCSGFVSATWNVAPPGDVTQSFPCYQISASDLQPGDALLNPSQHVALFTGWHSSGVPNVIEECGHTSQCCGSDETCPGACGSSAYNCDEYCPGCPIQEHTWPSILDGFHPCRRNGW